MDLLTPEQWMIIGSLVFELITVIIGFIIFLIQRKKSKLEKETATIQNETLKSTVQNMQNKVIDLETAICLSSFTYCPKCGEKLYFRDLDFNYGGKNDETQNKS